MPLFFNCKTGELSKKAMLKLDDLLIDGMKIYQDDQLYKFTSDSVLLSRFARAKKNDVVADFCAGSGIVGLHFYALHRSLIRSMTLFEMQEELCDLAKKSIELNGLSEIVSVRNVKIQDLSADCNEKFSLILCNPPYYPAADAEGRNFRREACRYELTLSLEELIAAAAKSLKFGGRFCIAHLSARLAEVIFLMKKYRLEPKRLTTVSGGGRIYLVLVEAVKGGRAGLKMENERVN